MTPTELLNLSLIKIGVSNGIADINESTRQAWTGKLLYDHNYRALLRSFPWAFATKYASLVWVAGSETAPVNGDWTYSYRYPADCIFARRVVPQGSLGRKFADDPTPYRVGRDATARLIFTNHTDDIDTPVAVLEYTTLDCDDMFPDDLFIDAFTWLLASKLAPSLSKDPKMGSVAYGMYAMAVNIAESVDLKEGQQEPPGEAEWIRGR